jgi:competence protein CoiA
VETCLYNGKQICAYGITNMNYALNYELKKEWKIASKNKELFCEECGMEVQLRVKDPRKKIPHFSHKLSDYKCSFSNSESRETEEHKKGKMLLYNYFKEKYPDTNTIINHRFPNKRRADLYIEFKNGDKLAIEYQRTELDILDWQERQGEYEKLGTNILWLLSGKEEKLQEKVRQIDVSFFQQIMLNELDKIAVYLDVDKVRIIFAKNMRYSDTYVVGNDFDELYIKSYNLNDVLIHPNGKIECDFIKEYKKSNEEFVIRYSNKCLQEEQQRQLVIEDEKRHKAELLKRKSEETIFRPRLSNIEFEVKSEEKTNRYCDGNIPYKNKIKYALNGDENAIDFTARHLREWGSSDDFKIITLICKYNYSKGNIKVKEVYNKIMEKARFDCENLDLEDKALHELECPFCKGKLNQRYGKFGAFVSCYNYPDCKFSFNI